MPPVIQRNPTDPKKIAVAVVADDLVSRSEVSREIQQLAMASGMGERFKVLALAKDVEGPLLGFQLRDRSGQL